MGPRTAVGAPGAGSALGSALVEWGDRHRRDLPWRTTRDPWAILVSEAMLQQTQVSRVVPKYLAFLERFPDPAALAGAAVGDVLVSWAGLGYNSRALRLRAAAAAIVARHGGRVPAGLDDLLALPGIGPYTARAVLAFAFEAPVGVLDTNAARVLARAVAGRPLRRGDAQRLADSLVPAGRAWAYNQAILDLGATVCSSRRPACERCPLARRCAWVAAEWAPPDPAVGTAGASGRQSLFAGSDRQGRGRLVAALVAGGLPVPAADLARVAGWPGESERAERVAATLVADGLAVRDPDGGLRLP
jgi:A/G-specific adenine glycosylase